VIGLLLVLLWRADEERSPHPSPHGDPSACAACHEPAAAGAAPDEMSFRTGGADGACRVCHSEDPHDVGLVPHAGQVPPEIPLAGGRLACFSCHDEPACSGGGPGAADPRFLRGGPYAGVGELCARCHPATAEERFDPHAAMASAPAERQVCEHCHEVAPDPDARTADIRVTGKNVCLGCHAKTRHAGLEAHLGLMPAATVEAATAAGLPFADGGEAVCLTCHDPHPPGATAAADERAGRVGKPVLPRRWREDVLLPALAERGPPSGGPLEPVVAEPALLRLPLARGELCAVCHDATSIDAARRETR
jgi:hypothetical protein